MDLFSTIPNLNDTSDTSLLPSQTNIIVHAHEKDADGTAYITENKERLTKEAEKVFELLKQGRRLSNLQCITDRITGSLSSRVSETNRYLKPHQIEVSKEWVYADGKRSFKEYFFSEKAIELLNGKL